jgi:hypothetical protein
MIGIVFPPDSQPEFQDLIDEGKSHLWPWELVVLLVVMMSQKNLDKGWSRIDPPPVGVSSAKAGKKKVKQET